MKQFFFKVVLRIYLYDHKNSTSSILNESCLSELPGLIILLIAELQLTTAISDCEASKNVLCGFAQLETSNLHFAFQMAPRNVA